MPGLFSKQPEWDDPERINDILFYFYKRINPQPNDKVLIMDPYFFFEKSVIEPFNEKLFENDNWSNFITLLCSEMKSGEFFIISEQDHNEIFRSNIYTSNNNKILTINHPEYKNCKLWFTRYSKNLNIPKSIHDRLLLVKRANKDNNIGFHIGPSLSDIHNKDFIVTRIDQSFLMDVINRFDDIWVKATK